MMICEVGGMKIGKGKHSTRKVPASVPLHPPQILHDRAPVAAVDNRELRVRPMLGFSANGVDISGFRCECVCGSVGQFARERTQSGRTLSSGKLGHAIHVI
jgi:hypothetical protein